MSAKAKSKLTPEQQKATMTRVLPVSYTHLTLPTKA